MEIFINFSKLNQKIKNGNVQVIKMKLFLVILFGKALNNLSVMIIGKLRCKIMILV